MKKNKFLSGRLDLVLHSHRLTKVGMGLSKELLKEVIFWSVGTCWIADNFENYSPDNNILKKIQNIKTNLKLRTTERIIS